jgi:hypothetical protein
MPLRFLTHGVVAIALVTFCSLAEAACGSSGGCVISGSTCACYAGSTPGDEQEFDQPCDAQTSGGSVCCSQPGYNCFCNALPCVVQHDGSGCSCAEQQPVGQTGNAKSCSAPPGGHCCASATSGTCSCSRLPCMPGDEVAECTLKSIPCAGGAGFNRVTDCSSIGQ